MAAVAGAPSLIHGANASAGAAWVQMVEGHAEARVISDSATCPASTIDGHRHVMSERAAVKDLDLGGVQMVLSGRVHNFTALDFGPTRPPQLVVGAGADLMDPNDLP